MTYHVVFHQAKHANGEHSWGINGETGKIVDMKEYGLYESASVKVSYPRKPLRILVTNTFPIDPDP